METIQLLTVEEAARMLKLTPYTIRRLLNEGKLPGKKIGGGRQWRIMQEDLALYLKEATNSGEQSVSASDAHAMSLMSEGTLAMDWLRPEEDEAWAHL